MNLTHIDLTDPSHCYFLGFVWGDGHLRKRKDRPDQYVLSVEISSRDRWHLEQLASLFDVPSNIRDRTRDTNFADGYASSALVIHTRTFCKDLMLLGLPTGKKSRTVRVPSEADPKHFFRGLIDADGSLGLTGTGHPFVSLCTQSEELAETYANFLVPYTGYVKAYSRNSRDGAFNLAIIKEHAQKLVQDLWGEDDIALPRKKEAVDQVLAWSRPEGMAVQDGQKNIWSEEENATVLGHPAKRAAELLPGRSLIAVASQRQRLRGQGRTYTY